MSLSPVAVTTASQARALLATAATNCGMLLAEHSWKRASMLTCSCTTAVASNAHQHSATTGKRCSSIVAIEEYMFVSISSCHAHLAPA
eukprot:13045-Heterococcus_DN1.PRE.1